MTGDAIDPIGVRKMKIEKHVTIYANSEIVFLHLVVPDLLMSWIKSMGDFRFITDIRNGDLQGAKFTYNAGGRDFEGEVLEYSPTSRYVGFFSSDAYEYTDEFCLKDSDGITTLSGIMDVRFKGI